MTPAGNSALQAQINSLGEQVNKGFGELKEMMRAFDERVRIVEQREAGCQPVLTSRMDAAWRSIDDHESRLKKIEEQTGKLMLAYGIMVFIASAIGLAVIMLIWSLVTGQAQVIFT